MRPSPSFSFRDSVSSSKLLSSRNLTANRFYQRFAAHTSQHFVKIRSDFFIAFSDCHLFLSLSPYPLSFCLQTRHEGVTPPEVSSYFCAQHSSAESIYLLFISSRHSISNGLNCPHSPVTIISIRFFMWNRFLYTRFVGQCIIYICKGNHLC